MLIGLGSGSDLVAALIGELVVSLVSSPLPPSSLSSPSLGRESRHTWCAGACRQSPCTPPPPPSRVWLGVRRVEAAVPGEHVVNLLAVVGPGSLIHMMVLDDHPRI